jgi:hypothetical protein
VSLVDYPAFCRSDHDAQKRNESIRNCITCCHIYEVHKLCQLYLLEDKLVREYGIWQTETLHVLIRHLISTIPSA